MENFKEIRKMIGYSEQGILSKDILKNNKLNVSLFCMAKGTEISEHTSTKQGFVFVIEGKGIFSLGGKNIEMLPDAFIQMRENVAHSLKAEENTSFLLSLVN